MCTKKIYKMASCPVDKRSGERPLNSKKAKAASPAVTGLTNLKFTKNPVSAHPLGQLYDLPRAIN